MFSNDCSLGLALTNEHHGCVTPCQYLIASKLTAECGDHNNQKICELAKIPGLVFSGYWPPLTEPTFAHSAALVTQGSLHPFAAIYANGASVRWLLTGRPLTGCRTYPCGTTRSPPRITLHTMYDTRESRSSGLHPVSGPYFIRPSGFIAVASHRGSPLSSRALNAAVLHYSRSSIR